MENIFNDLEYYENKEGNLEQMTHKEAEERGLLTTCPVCEEECSVNAINEWTMCAICYHDL